MTSINTVDESSHTRDGDEPVCYLCLDGGDDDEAGQPLRRDCACRGLSCLAAFAESKSKQARSMDEFRNPWGECPGCHQYYQNGLAVDIATKFVLQDVRWILFK